jgi:negative regulator of flagellin synthesis FlgM
MKIDPQKITESLVPKRDAQSIQKPPAAEQTDKAANVKNTTPADTVNISSKSKQIADIMSAINQLPDVRDSKVEEIKKNVDAGTYTVDPYKVAANILKEI